MRTAWVALLVSAVAWVSGNVLLVAMAKPLFAHAPGEHGGGGRDFSSHYAAGAVFGDLLSVWSTIVTAALLPVLAVAAVSAAVAAMKSGRKLPAYLLLIATLIAAACHVWSATIIANANQLLAALLSGAAEGSEWTRFHLLHRESQGSMGAETLFVLVLAVSAAVALARASSTGKER